MTTIARHVGLALSERKLRSVFGLGNRYDFNRLLALRDVTPHTGSDFNIKALDSTNLWSVAAGSGASTWVVRAEAGGWIRGVTGTSSGVSGLQLSLTGQKYWTGASYAMMSVGFRLSDLSEIRIETGFVDALPAVNTNVVSSTGSAALATATAGAIFLYDHNGTATTTGLYTAGTTVSAAKVATTTRQPVVSTLYVVTIEVIGTNVYCWSGPDADAPVASAAGSVASADGLFPFLSAKNSDANSTNVDIDFLYAWSGRLG